MKTSKSQTNYGPYKELEPTDADDEYRRSKCPVDYVDHLGFET